jgi:hypothetical protein
MKTNFFSRGILASNRSKGGTKSVFAGALLAATTLLFACSTISTYDQAAYEHATSAKVDALALMDKATDSFSAHAKEVETVNLTLSKAYEYDKGRPLNAITLKQWNLLLSPDHDLFGGFLRDWKSKGQFKPVAVSEKKKQVGNGFDQIIGLESGKLKPSDIKL